MAVKQYLYNIPGDYTFDSAKVDVSGGIASLKEDLTNVYARWHLNESSGTNVPDSSGNGRDGTCVNMEDADWVAGKLNNCLSFDGVNGYVNCGNIGDFERTDSFSIECWFKTSGSAQVLLSKMQGASPWRGWAVETYSTGKIVVYLINIFGSNAIYVKTDLGGWNDNAWHHCVVTYDGSSSANGVKIYIDDALEAHTAEVNNLTDSIRNINPCCIASRNGTLLYFAGDVDEVIIYDKELIQSEVTFRYNSGVGRENFLFPTDKPTIEPIDLFDPTTVISWDSFLETLGGGNEGSIGYNLYKVDKANKYYWNGSVWVTGGSGSNYNSQVVINTNIESFDATPDKIGFIAYLISDGEQIVELDENQITYTVNQLPLVNAGSNKSCKDNDIIAPFSDCSFSDPDGTVIKAEYKVDGEVDIWTEIPQGGYGTLLEAVQAFNYQFTNSGTKTVRLQVEDNEGATSEDSLEVDVQKFQVIFNVKNLSGIHLPDINFNPDDGTGWQIVNSPFTYNFDYNISGYDIIINKTNYKTQTKNVPSTDHTENFTLIALGDIDVTRVYCPLRINISDRKPQITLRPLRKKINIKIQCPEE